MLPKIRPHHHPAPEQSVCRRCLRRRRYRRFARVMMAYGIRGFFYGAGGAVGGYVCWLLIEWTVSR